MLFRSGCIGPEANLIPVTIGRLAELCTMDAVLQLTEFQAQVTRFAALANRWTQSTARWIKMGWKILHLPGGGVLRPPYLPAPTEDLRQFADGLAKLGVAEIDGLFKAQRAKANS